MLRPARRRASRGLGPIRPAGRGPRRARAPRRATSAPSSWTSLRASDHVGKWTWESVNAGRAHRPRRSTRSGVGSALSCVPTPPTTRSPAIARAAAVGKRGIHGADDAVRQDHAPEPSARTRGATIGSRPEDRLSFDRPLALLSLAVLAVLAAGFVTLARRRPPVRRPLSERRRPARRLVARERACGGMRRSRSSPPRSRSSASRMAGPHVTRSAPVENATVVLVVDTSRSMLSTDVRPTRLDAAKTAARRFLERAPDKLRVGLVTFSGDVSVGAVPTRDRERVRRSVAEISRWQAGGGTAIGDALARAVELGRSAFGETGGTHGRGLEGPRERGQHPLPLRRAPESRAAPARGGRVARGRGRDPRVHGRAGDGSSGRRRRRRARELRRVRRLQPRPGPGDAPGDRRGDGRRVLRRAVGGGARVGLPPARLPSSVTRTGRPR